jgi:hypothetical protein
MPFTFTIGQQRALVETAELTIGQQRALAVLPKITGFSSFIFSLVIAITIFRDKKKFSKVYHRLIFGMSCADISSSLWLAMSTWPIPKETGVLWAVGNTTTCSFQGFFTQFGISSPLYNVSLSFYYLLAVRYSWRESHLKKVEPFFHVLPFAWALGTAIAGLFLKIFNSANLWCWIASYPGRNMDTNVYRWALFYGPLWLAIFLVTMNLIFVYAKVRAVLIETEMYINPSRAFRIEDISVDVYYDQGFSRQQFATGNSYDMASQPDGENATPSRLSLARSIRNSIRGSLGFQRRQSSRRTLSGKRRREVFNQCLRYALALYWTWIPLTVSHNLIDENLQWKTPIISHSLSSSFLVASYPSNDANHRTPSRLCNLCLGGHEHPNARPPQFSSLLISYDNRSQINQSQ